MIDAPWVTVSKHATRRLDKQTQLNFSSMWADFETGINQEEGGVGGGEGRGWADYETRKVVSRVPNT